jgi:hypothetical protein
LTDEQIRASDRRGDAVALADAMPRILIAEERSEALAEDWVRRVGLAVDEGHPRFPRYPFARTIRDGLFEARRARRVIRGLEGAESTLETEEAGLSRAAATRPDPVRSRISRLLIIASDGSPRFYRNVERLRERFETRLEVLTLDCDETALGEAVFGADRRARALMIDHKDAVSRFLTIICDALEEEGDPNSESVL